MIANSNVFEQFAILNAGTATIYDIATGELESIINNCNSFTLTTQSDSVEIKKRGEVCMNISKPKTGTLKFSAETTSFAQLNLALGGAGFVLNDAIDTFQKTQNFTVTDTASIIINLTNEAKSADDVYVKLMTRDGEIAKNLAFTIDVTNLIVTVTTDADIEVGDTISVIYEASMAVGTVYSFKVPSKGLSKAKRIVIDVLASNETDQSPMLLQFDLYKVAVTEGIEIMMDSENASKFDISMKVLSDYTQQTSEDGSQFFKVSTPVEV